MTTPWVIAVYVSRFGSELILGYMVITWIQAFERAVFLNNLM